jgi:acyl dehydratase
MPIDYDDLITRRSENRRFSYTDTQMMLYNQSVGMGRDPLNEKELPFVFERPLLRVVPTAATALITGGQPILAGVDIDWTQVLHGEQRLKVHRPLPPSADLVACVRVSDVIDKGVDKGALIAIEVDVKLASGEPLYTTENVTFARADGGFGGPSKSTSTIHQLPDRKPDFIHVTETRRDQALLFRLNGDRNPLHADPKLARKAGFDVPILHGTCTYGIACRAVLASICDYNVTRMKSFDVRFTSPIFPGETIHTDIWVDGDIVSFRSRVDARNVVALNNGRCEISDAR